MVAGRRSLAADAVHFHSARMLDHLPVGRIEGVAEKGVGPIAGTARSVSGAAGRRTGGRRWRLQGPPWPLGRLLLLSSAAAPKGPCHQSGFVDHPPQAR